MIGKHDVSKALDEAFRAAFMMSRQGITKSSSAPTRYGPQTRLAFPLRPFRILSHHTIGVKYIDIKITQTILKGTS
jgi:hypothetical protein